MQHDASLLYMQLIKLEVELNWVENIIENKHKISCDGKLWKTKSFSQQHYHHITNEQQQQQQLQQQKEIK